MKKTMTKKTKKKRRIQEEKKKPNPGPGGGEGSTSTSAATPPPPPGGPDDRISELPVEILHHILGFLEMDELLIRTSLVSTKWRNLWKSVSTLNFPNCITSRRRTDDDSVVVDNGGGGGDGIRNNVETYQNFVDHVLCLRDSQASRIRVLKYDCKSNRRVSGYDYLERLHNFIVNAVVNQGAQEIQVKGYYYLEENCNNMIHFNPSIFTSGCNNMIHFNPSIFTSGELRKFTFTLLTADDFFLLKFPRSMCSATQLTHLTLFGIILPEGDDDSNATAQLHLVCPLLEELVICNCYSEHLKVLDISAPRLDTLYIDNRGFGGSADFLGGCRIEIRTPYLTSLTYSGSVYVDCFTDNLPRLVFARLNFNTETGMVEKTTSFATKLLKGLTSAKFLVLEGFEDTLLKLLTPFTSLSTLKLATSGKISSILGIVHILNNCNSIEYLIVEFCTVEGGDEHLMLPQCRLPHLKRVRMERLHGHKYQIEFVKFLLKSSVVLEDLIIITTKNSPKRLLIEENLKQFIEEEPSVRRSIKLYVLEESS